ncbi:winged helix-turn-helix transcriptional regulator [Vagococcus sp. BWB3-3]|uniref:Winged helix-turn-helix transcriptional regulator n=1 Tax=Vagococcus allomyrinae TaxID=2794353 RepID=A0A940PE28_9ENTE|nr:MarR family winged helix-turn-helix transcriptional regulator [Vagococcus allomyrinae]MBP1041796.1 winged helix-turn-helix transcriptional regulator [Vagococcus allomyrinae]
MMPEDIQRMNSFIKYFLNYINYLEKEMADDSYNFNEIRVIFELLENGQMYAKDIENELDLDKGYTSRILKRLLDEDLIERQQSNDDKRLYYVSFTKTGKKQATELYHKYEKVLSKDYEGLSDDERQPFLESLELIEKLHKRKFHWKNNDD